MRYNEIISVSHTMYEIRGIFRNISYDSRLVLFPDCRIRQTLRQIPVVEVMKVKHQQKKSTRNHPDKLLTTNDNPSILGNNCQLSKN